MASEPLLAADGETTRRPSARGRFKYLIQLILARAPTNGTRVTESLDYEPIQNDLYFQRLKARKGTRHLYGYSGLTLSKNLVVIITGACTGLVAVFMSKSVGALISWRNESIEDMLTANPAHFSYPFLFNIAYGLVLTSVGALMVTFWAPAAAGAGVTLVMAYLNGNHIPNLLKFQTLVTKIIGATCGVASGLAIGPEGPMVHIGACIASNVVYADCSVLPWLWPWAACARRRAMVRADPDDSHSGVNGNEVDPAVLEDGGPGRTLCATWEALHEDSEHREFISAGASAGLSAAFGAPIGGVLFSMEEACSFWSKKVAWRCFVAAILAAFTISQLSEHGDAGVIIFNSIRTLDNLEWLWQLPLMVAIAAFGGVLGALFNMLRRALWRVRASRSRKFLRVAEALAVNAFCVVIMFWVPLLYHSCVDIPEAWTSLGFKGVRWSCPEGKHNELATSFQALADDVLGRMFSVGTDYTKHEASSPGFTVTALMIYGSCYLVMMALGSGVCVPAGLFMPSISLGASWGLAAGLAMEQALPHWHIQPGLYALICATAVLAGVFRSAISLVVLVVEGTRGINFLFGVIIAVVVANFVASVLEHEGVYESEIERDGNVFFLRHEPPRKLATLTAADIMVPSPIAFPPVVALRDVLRVLRLTTHHGFPVVTDGQFPTAGGYGGVALDGVGQLEGLVLRSQLLVLLRERVFCDSVGNPLRQCHTSRAAQYRIEREMRTFYHKSYTHHRYASTADPAIARLGRALDRSATFSLGRTRANPDSAFDEPLDSNRSFVPTGTQFSELDFLPGGAHDIAVTDERVDAELAELAEVLKAVGSAQRLYMDLRPYMNPAPLTVRKEMSAARVHRTFVTLGMRHLCVINSKNRVVGIITRKDLDRAAGHGAGGLGPGSSNHLSQTPSYSATTSRAGMQPRDSLLSGLTQPRRSLQYPQWVRTVDKPAPAVSAKSSSVEPSSTQTRSDGASTDDAPFVAVDHAVDGTAGGSAGAALGVGEVPVAAADDVEREEGEIKGDLPAKAS